MEVTIKKGEEDRKFNDTVLEAWKINSILTSYRVLSGVLKFLTLVIDSSNFHRTQSQIIRRT